MHFSGKTTLLRNQFSPAAIINLLRAAEYLPPAQNPSLLAERVREICRDHPTVIIDDIQKLPALLDEVHDLIETEGTAFVLTGSSGRKLKRAGVNLSAGRAWRAALYPPGECGDSRVRSGPLLAYGWVAPGLSWRDAP